MCGATWHGSPPVSGGGINGVFTLSPGRRWGAGPGRPPGREGVFVRLFPHSLSPPFLTDFIHAHTWPWVVWGLTPSISRVYSLTWHPQYVLAPGPW